MINQLEAAKFSVVLQALQEKKNNDAIYSTGERWKFPGIVAQQKVIVPCATELQGFITGGQGSVDIPPYGFLTRAYLKLTVGAYKADDDVGTDNGAMSAYPAIACMKKVEYSTSTGTSISQLYPQTILEKVLTLEQNAQDRLVTAVGTGTARLVDRGVGKDPVTCYLPLLFDMFDHPSTWPDLLTTEKMMFTFTPEAIAAWTTGTAGFSTLDAAELHCYYAQFPTEQMTSILSQKHPGGAPFNFFGTTNFKEASKTANTTTYNFELHCPSPIIKTIITARATGGTDLASYLAVKSVTIQDSGSVIWKSTKDELEQLEQNILKGKNMVVFDWGALLPFTETGAQSAISVHQMSNPKIIVEFAAGADRVVEVVHHVYNALSISAGSKNRMITILGAR